MDNTSEPSYRKRVDYQAILLGGFATLAAALIAIGNASTHDDISTRLQEDIQTSLSQVIPKNVYDNNLLENTVTLDNKGHPVLFYRATKEGKLTAVAFSVSGKGYSGEIVLTMGVDATGQLLGVRVLSHSETPGLGDKIEEKKDDWIYSFNGLSLSNTPDSDWAVKKDGGRFDQFSGATITPRAVVKAVKKGLILFKTFHQELLVDKNNSNDNNNDKDKQPNSAQDG